MIVLSLFVLLELFGVTPRCLLGEIHLKNLEGSHPPMWNDRPSGILFVALWWVYGGTPWACQVAMHRLQLVLGQRFLMTCVYYFPGCGVPVNSRHAGNMRGMGPRYAEVLK